MRSETFTEIAKALAAAQGEIKQAAQDGWNPMFQSKYAKLPALWDVAREPLSKNGLALVQTIEYDAAGAFLQTELLHTSGEWIRSFFRLTPEKATAQAFGSQLTYARRYSMAALLGLTSDDDDDGNAASTAQEKRQQQGDGAPQQQKRQAAQGARPQQQQTRQISSAQQPPPPPPPPAEYTPPSQALGEQARIWAQGQGLPDAVIDEFWETARNTVGGYYDPATRPTESHAMRVKFKHLVEAQLEALHAAAQTAEDEADAEEVSDDDLFTESEPED